MAFTPTEEAQVRLLLAQQASILSLAGNEATITSKLGATKVTLSDLAVASSANASDLMLTRQGVTDKSITPLVLSNYIGASYLAKAGGTATGAINLSAGGTSTTSALFDSSTNIASTAFVQRALGNLAGASSETANRTLTSADIGKLLCFQTNAGLTLTLPSTAGLPVGATFHFKNMSPGAATVAAPVAMYIYAGNTPTSITLTPGEEITIILSPGSTWAVAGPTSTRLLDNFAFDAAGYQKFPNGLIMQWGGAASVPQGSNVTVTYPIQFPTALIVAVATNRAGINSTIPVGVAVGTSGSTSSLVLLNVGNNGPQSPGYIALGY